MNVPFRNQDVATAARTEHVLEEIEALRERLSAYEGENRDAVLSAQLDRLRADITQLRAEREELAAELRRLELGEGDSGEA
jgi:predicted RNase H-like nuclease (RuvC/YqgF family)